MPAGEVFAAFDEMEMQGTLFPLAVFFAGEVATAVAGFWTTNGINEDHILTLFLL